LASIANRSPIGKFGSVATVASGTGKAPSALAVGFGALALGVAALADAEPEAEDVDVAEAPSEELLHDGSKASWETTASAMSNGCPVPDEDFIDSPYARAKKMDPPARSAR
jgi:hypothetical protein